MQAIHILMLLLLPISVIPLSVPSSALLKTYLIKLPSTVPSAVLANYRSTLDLLCDPSVAPSKLRKQLNATLTHVNTIPQTDPHQPLLSAHINLSYLYAQARFEPPTVLNARLTSALHSSPTSQADHAIPAAAITLKHVQFNINRNLKQSPNFSALREQYLPTIGASLAPLCSPHQTSPLMNLTTPLLHYVAILKLLQIPAPAPLLTLYKNLYDPSVLSDPPATLLVIKTLPKDLLPDILPNIPQPYSPNIVQALLKKLPATHADQLLHQMSPPTHLTSFSHLLETLSTPAAVDVLFGHFLNATASNKLALLPKFLDHCSNESHAQSLLARLPSPSPQTLLSTTPSLAKLKLLSAMANNDTRLVESLWTAKITFSTKAQFGTALTYLANQPNFLTALKTLPQSSRSHLRTSLLRTLTTTDSNWAFLSNSTQAFSHLTLPDARALSYIIASSPDSHKETLALLQLLPPLIAAAVTPTHRRALEGFLSAAILTLKKTGQSAWITRVVSDWLIADGPLSSRTFLLAAKTLCDEDDGDAVLSLVGLMRSVPDYDLLSGVVHVMHSRGLYDSMDSLYALGLEMGVFQFPVEVDEGGKQVTIDLHGHSVSLATSVVRTVLMRYCMRSDKEIGALRIITGKGKNSRHALRPVLRPEVQRMLSEEFYPPLNTVTGARGRGDMGVLEVDNVGEWREYNRVVRDEKIKIVGSLLGNVGRKVHAATKRAVIARDNDNDW